jgi:hypothetical protein
MKEGTKIYQLWYDYLDLINNMSKLPGAYTLDNIRTVMHKDLTKYYIETYGDINSERFNQICHNLNKVINFKPPLEKHDTIKPYANELEKRFSIGDLKHYILNRIDKINL